MSDSDAEYESDCDPMPNQANSPFDNEPAVEIKQTAANAVETWLGSDRAGGVEEATISGSDSRVGVDVTVEFDGWLNAPFATYRTRRAAAELVTVYDSGLVAVRVFPVGGDES